MPESGAAKFPPNLSNKFWRRQSLGENTMFLIISLCPNKLSGNSLVMPRKREAGLPLPAAQTFFAVINPQVFSGNPSKKKDCGSAPAMTTVPAQSCRAEVHCGCQFLIAVKEETK
jgi:hypothetical protein